jgi:hypothetical protein
MTDGTKDGAQRARSLRPRCFGEVDPETATHIYLPIYIHMKFWVLMVTNIVGWHGIVSIATQNSLGINWWE